MSYGVLNVQGIQEAIKFLDQVWGYYDVCLFHAMVNQYLLFVSFGWIKLGQLTVHLITYWADLNPFEAVIDRNYKMRNCCSIFCTYSW